LESCRHDKFPRIQDNAGRTDLPSQGNNDKDKQFSGGYSDQLVPIWEDRQRQRGPKLYKMVLKVRQRTDSGRGGVFYPEPK
jgi:hypothetical protein